MTNQTNWALVTRQHFANLCKGCIVEVLDGTVTLPTHVTLGEYAYRQYRNAQSWLSGENDHTFVFQQRMHYLKTGESVALLP